MNTHTLELFAVKKRGKFLILQVQLCNAMLIALLIEVLNFNAGAF